jgi:hypothetical protein
MRKKGADPERPAKPGRLRKFLVVTATIALTAGLFTAAILLRGGEPQGGSLPASTAAQGSQVAPITVAADSGFGVLIGRWLRPDGGYVLEIRGVDASGTIVAVYLNPRPINVARAEATRDGSTLKVVVELRAPNYPGSTYTLTYDPKRDQLTGTYFQAVLQQTFDVAFVRIK